MKAYRKLNYAGIESVVDDTKSIIAPVILGVFEIGVIGDIERFAAHLGAELFGDSEVLLETKVESEESRAHGDITLGVAGRVDRLQSERIDVQELKAISVWIDSSIWVTYTIGTQVAVTIIYV